MTRLISVLTFFLWPIIGLYGQANPFLRPGSKPKAPPVVRKPAPVPPAPIPMNPNLEFRGYFKFEGIWHLAIFDKSKNRGEWLKAGESLMDGGQKIEGFDVDAEEVSLEGGHKLSLKEPEKKTLPLPGGGSSVPQKPPGANIPPPRR